MKIPPKNNREAEPWRLKSKRGNPQMKAMESTSTPSSSRPSKWKQILGARGTVNPSQQPRIEENDSGEFHIDLNRFGSACTSFQDQAVTPGFGHMNAGRTFPPSTFMTKPVVTMMQTEGDEAPAVSTVEVSKDEPALGSPSVKIVKPTPRGSEEVLLWKRRSGACRPLTLELQRRVLKSDFR
ncbi:hypothetical protein KC19_6G002700 [Ceratodon purpureus]|nr:hypothetical protein KC19_6G002700 [Ceratodon purpureus]